MIYKSKPRSYRELPIRYCEFGSVYRWEQSGELHGLLRVRGFTQDDGHIFCTREQLKDEIIGVIDLTMYFLSCFGFKDYEIWLSVRDPAKKEKYMGDDELWEIAERALVEALESKGLKYIRAEGEAKFYGPAIDIMIKDVFGRKWQCTTIQVDFNLPEKFNANYIGSDDKEHRVIMVHRAPLGSLERFFAVLIEHYGGAFPTWLSPVQVRVISVADRHIEHAEKISKKLEENNIRVERDFSKKTVEYKIRDAEIMKIPYIIVVGDKEISSNTIAVRKRGEGKVKYGVNLNDFISEIKREIEEKVV